MLTCIPTDSTSEDESVFPMTGTPSPASNQVNTTFPAPPRRSKNRNQKVTPGRAPLPYHLAYVDLPELAEARKRLRHPKSQKIIDDDNLNDPYFAAMLISLAQEQRAKKRQWGMPYPFFTENPPVQVLLVTMQSPRFKIKDLSKPKGQSEVMRPEDKEEAHWLHIYTARVEKEYLDRWDFPKEMKKRDYKKPRFTVSNGDWNLGRENKRFGLEIERRKLKFEPYETFPWRFKMAMKQLCEVL